MQTPVEKERCTGCWACANGCPAGCISMEPDEEGFLYPKIDAAACTDCGLCRRVCPAARSVPVEGDVPKAYALHALDRELLEGSASGGGSTLLAQRMLERGGVVFGAVFDEAFLVYHGRIENMAELERFQGSKYPQRGRLSSDQGAAGAGDAGAVHRDPLPDRRSAGLSGAGL